MGEVLDQCLKTVSGILIILGMSLKLKYFVKIDFKLTLKANLGYE
jgi:hypothetical protein